MHYGLVGTIPIVLLATFLVSHIDVSGLGGLPLLVLIILLMIGKLLNENAKVHTNIAGPSTSIRVALLTATFIGRDQMTPRDNLSGGRQGCAHESCSCAVHSSRSSV